MSQALDTQLFAGMVKSKRGEKGLRTVAQEIGGISSATLSRIEQGKVPDVDTFIKVCRWLEVPTDYFTKIEIPNSSVGVSNYSKIVAHLRADRELASETIETIVKLINLAYKAK